MRFSVVIPTCNRPDGLRACLARLAPGVQSLAADNYEVIVTDDSATPIDTLIRREFPWARWTRGPRRGPAANRNHGASLARGDWLAFTDDDCLPSAEWLQSFAAAQASVPVVHMWEGRTFCAERNPGPLRFAPVNEQGGKLWSCNFAIARVEFARLGGFDACFPHPHLEDVDFHRRAVGTGLRVSFCAAAAVEHPPRHLGSAVRQARTYASYFYFARKHHVSLAAAGLGLRAFLRWRFVCLRSSRSAGEAVRFAWRCLVEAACLAVLVPWWAVSGRPRPVSVVCVNSTLPVRRAMRRDGRASPLHHWGYAPGPNDTLLAHRLNRVEITLRAKIDGLDLRVLLLTYLQLWRGAAGVFLVTQPDLLAALPWLRRRFPHRRFVAWVWMDWEVDRHLRRLAACDHILCLSPGAKRRLDELGLAARSSYVVWGCDPAHYHLAPPSPIEHDVLVSGLTSRDTALMCAALGAGGYRALIVDSADAVLRSLAPEQHRQVSTVAIDREEVMIRAYHRCHVSWIPLRTGDPYLPGFTNLIESLLCGTAVVLSDCTRIAPSHLELPGVFLHRTGDVPDFLRATESALAFARAPGNRARIADAAAAVFDGRELAVVARHALGLPAAS